MNLVERHIRGAKRLLDRVAGVSGTYGREIYASGALMAVPRLPGIDAQQLDSGALLTAEELDWMFTAEDLVLDGTIIEPAKGDWWRYERSDGKFAYYDVLPDATGRCYERSDQFDALIRVHTKLNRVEAPPQ